MGFIEGPPFVHSTLAVGEARDDYGPFTVYEIVSEGTPYIVGVTLLEADAHEIVRRWNAFVEQGEPPQALDEGAG